MSEEWDEACKSVKRRLGIDVLIPELQEMKRVGDKLQTENRHIAELYGIQVDRTHVLQQKIEAIKKIMGMWDE